LTRATLGVLPSVLEHGGVLLLLSPLLLSRMLLHLYGAGDMPVRYLPVSR
jgi:hypothetical protein